MAAPFQLHREVRHGNIAQVRELLREGAELNAADRAGDTPLGYALRSPAAPVELVHLLFDRGGVVVESSHLEGSINVVSVCLKGGDPLKLAFILERGLTYITHGITATTRSLMPYSPSTPIAAPRCSPSSRY